MAKAKGKKTKTQMYISILTKLGLHATNKLTEERACGRLVNFLRKNPDAELEGLSTGEQSLVKKVIAGITKQGKPKRTVMTKAQYEAEAAAEKSPKKKKSKKSKKATATTDDKPAKKSKKAKAKKAADKTGPSAMDIFRSIFDKGTGKKEWTRAKVIAQMEKAGFRADTAANYLSWAKKTRLAKNPFGFYLKEVKNSDGDKVLRRSKADADAK